MKLKSVFPNNSKAFYSLVSLKLFWLLFDHPLVLVKLKILQKLKILVWFAFKWSRFFLEYEKAVSMLSAKLRQYSTHFCKNA